MSANHRPANPYVGPRSFRTGEKIYGRDGELFDLFNLFISARIVLLYSPSGAGKSSLVQAGLIPLLQDEGLYVQPVIRLSLDLPASFEQPSGESNRYLLSTLLSLEEALPETARFSLDELVNLSLDEYLKRSKARRQGNGKTVQPHIGSEDDSPRESSTQEFGEVLIFDQFEEVLTLDPTDQANKASFFKQLGEALRDRQRWGLFVLREDYLAGLDPYLLPIPTRFSSPFRLDFLKADAARQAIQKPARQAGVDFSDEAAGKLVDDLRRIKVQQPDGTLEEQLGPYIEPVQLQVVCSNLWEKMESGSTQITLADLADVGDVDYSLGEYYANKVETVAKNTGASERAIREWFEKALITEQNVRSQVLRVQNEGLDDAVVRELVDAHLVRAEKRRGLTWYELTHDRLIGPLRKNNERWFEAHLSLLQQQAALWERNRQADHLLLRDEKLKEAEDWAASHDAELTPSDREFLKSSLDAQISRDQALELEIERQRAAERARRAAILRWLLIVAVILAILAVFFGITANSARLVAQSQQAAAETNKELANIQAGNAQRFASQAADERGTAQLFASQAAVDRGTAEAASTKAIRQEATANFYATQSNLEATQKIGEASSSLLAAQALGYLDSQPRISSLLAIEAYRTAPIWEAKNVLLSGLQRSLTQTVVDYGTPIPPQDYNIYTVALSPDGEHLAWGDTDGEIVIWNYETGTEELRVSPNTLEVWSVAFSPDGKYLASTGKDGRIFLTDVASGQSELLTQTFQWSLALSYSPDGTKLATANGIQVEIWDIEAKKLLLTMPVEHQGYVYSITWSPDGKKLASSSFSGEIRVWDAMTGVGYYLQRRYGGTVWSVSWSPDGRWLASSAENGKLILWDMVNNRVETELDDIHGKQAVYSVSFSNDGRLLASSGNDGDVVLFKVPSMELFDRIEELQRGVRSVAFIPQNKKGLNLLASGGYDKTVKMSEVISQQPLSSQVTAGSGERALALAVSAGDEAPLAAVESSGQLSVTGIEQLLGQEVSSAAFSPDGNKLAAGQQDGLIKIFDVNSGEMIQTLEGPSREVQSLAFNSQGDWLASGYCIDEMQQGSPWAFCISDILIWDIARGETPIVYPVDVGPVRALAFHPNTERTYLAAGTDSGSILIWDVLRPQLEGRQLARFPSGVTSLAFNTRGDLMASGREDSTLILWDASNIDATNPKAIGDALLGSPSSIRSLVFAPSGESLFSGDERGNILAWDVSLDSWIERNCDLAKGNLTESEWAQFFPDRLFPNQSFLKTCPQYP